MKSNHKSETLPAKAGSRLTLNKWRENPKQTQMPKPKTQNRKFIHAFWFMIFDFGFV